MVLDGETELQDGSLGSCVGKGQGTVRRDAQWIGGWDLRPTQGPCEVITSLVTSRHFFSIITKNSKLSSTQGQTGLEQDAVFFPSQQDLLSFTQPSIGFLCSSPFRLCFIFPLFQAIVCVVCGVETVTLIWELKPWLYMSEHESGYTHDFRGINLAGKHPWNSLSKKEKTEKRKKKRELTPFLPINSLTSGMFY